LSINRVENSEMAVAADRCKMMAEDSCSSLGDHLDGSYQIDMYQNGTDRSSFLRIYTPVELVRTLVEAGSE
jgi:hypothetical protein